MRVAYVCFDAQDFFSEIAPALEIIAYGPDCPQRKYTGHFGETTNALTSGSFNNQSLDESARNTILVAAVLDAGHKQFVKTTNALTSGSFNNQSLD
jgi:hypothetical protein